MSSATHADHIVPSTIAAPDRRGSSRAVTVYKVVKVERDGKEGLARCRNISDGGMKLDVAMPLMLNDSLMIELTPELVLPARVIWTNSNQCGVAFDRHIDCVQLLNRAAEAKPLRPRGPRLNSHIPARIAADGEVVATTIKNISQRGMLVTHSGQFRPGLHVKVVMNEGSERDATVQWVRENFAGLFLRTPYSVMDLGNLPSIGESPGH